MTDKVLELNPGCAGKGEVLRSAIVAVLDDKQFQDMTLFEIIGVLEAMKLDINALRRI
jgi:phage tail protein X